MRGRAFGLAVLLGAGVPAAGQDGWTALDADREAAMAFASGYAGFLGKARTEIQTVAQAFALARQKGGLPLPEAGPPRPGALARPGAVFLANNRDRACAIVVWGVAGPSAGLRIVACHDDAPRIDLKARPVYEREGFACLQTVYHGGIRSYQWANVPLALVGRCAFPSGEVRDIACGLGPDDPVLVIPAPAPHEDKPFRERKMPEVLEGEELDPLAAHEGGTDGVVKRLEALLAERWKLGPRDLISAELSLVPATPPADVGLDRSMLGGYGQDPRLAVYAAVRGLLDLDGPPAKTALVYLADNEETGSVNNTGARGTFLRDTIARLVEMEDPAGFHENRVRVACTRSEVLSSDPTTGVNPLFASTQEVGNAARLGGGVVIKRYGRGMDGNAEFLAKLRGLCEREGIPYQTHTYKVDVGGGGTIGQFLAQENMEVADVGAAILSMHSPFEVASKADVWWLYRLSRAFLAGR